MQRLILVLGLLLSIGAMAYLWQVGGQDSARPISASLTVSEANGCGYCVAAHCAIGKSVGLSDSELTDARQSSSPDSKADAALQFARQLVEKRGWVGDEDMGRVRRAAHLRRR